MRMLRCYITDRDITEIKTETLSVANVDVGTARAKLLRQPDVAMGKVIENRFRTKHGARDEAY